eukprot:11188382-Lingulodinium_polyedra.AAC.1
MHVSPPWCATRTNTPSHGHRIPSVKHVVAMTIWACGMRSMRTCLPGQVYKHMQTLQTDTCEHTRVIPSFEAQSNLGRYDTGAR